MNDTFVKNEKLYVTLNTGVSFEGLFHSENIEFGRLSFTNLEEYPRRKKLAGLHHFHKHEIKNIKRFSNDSDSISSENSSTSKGEKNKSENDHHVEAVNFSPITAFSFTQKEFEALKKLMDLYHYVYRLDSEFYGSISHLKECKEIAVCLMDTSRGRFDRASVIAVASKTYIFIYDLELIGDAALDQGLRDILQSHGIKKIFHDCRLASDCLFHKHCTKLNNVRDVEAEDILVRQKYEHKIRRHSSTLSELIENYLGISNATIDVNCDTKTIRVRPLSDGSKVALASQVAYLITLHNAIQEKYLKLHFYELSNIYSNIVRNANLMVATTSPNTINYVPLDEVKVLLKVTRNNVRKTVP